MLENIFLKKKFIQRVSLFVCLVLTACLFFTLSPSPVFGVSDSFSVSTYVSSDTVPPSAPSGLTATPVALSQIDLAWASSTDDSGTIAGYRIWRNTVMVATTSLLTYSDTGLTPGTSYTYYITAFDASSNESASSTSVAINTSSGPQYGSRTIPLDEMITTLQIFPQRDSVIVRYETQAYVRAVVRWGSGVSYELGSLIEQPFSTQHEAHVTGLVPGTQYSFVIEGEDGIGRYGSLHIGTFTTLPPDDIFPPGNVTGLRGEIINQDIFLSWINPEDPDFTKVRVLRSDRFYPSDTADGWVVYEGLENSIRDVGAVAGERQFYTVFTYDDKGNVSSGAVLSIQTGTSSNEVVNPTINPIDLSFDDVSIFQDSVALSHEGNVVYIDGARQFTVSIPYEKLPEHLKTILVRIGDSRDSNRTFEFLLRVDVGHTVYTGTIAPFGVAGEFPVAISVFDFETTQVGYTWGVLNSHIRPIHTDNGVGDGFLAYLREFSSSYLMWLLLLLLLLIFMSRRLYRVGE